MNHVKCGMPQKINAINRFEIKFPFFLLVLGTKRVSTYRRRICILINFFNNMLCVMFVYGYKD